MNHTNNLGKSLVASEIDAKHVGVGFMKVVADTNGDYHWERVNPADVTLKLKENE